MNDQTKMAAVLNNIAIACTNKKDFTNAEKYLDSSLAIRKGLNDLYGIGQTYNNYGAMYFKMNEFQKALSFYKLGYENRITAKVGSGGTIESQINIGKSYFKLNDKQNAIYWLELALSEAKKIRHFEFQKRASEYLKDLYYQMNNFSKAYELQSLYYRMNDSLYGMDKKNMVENLVLQNQFETKIRQDSIGNFEKIRLEKTVAIEKEKRDSILFFVLVIGIIFLSVFVFNLYKSNANKKKANSIILKQRDALDQKQKEVVASMNYAKRIQESLLPTDKYIEKNLNRLKQSKKQAPGFRKNND
jgi:tetratricopeptide (TPR) repeat protein